MVMWLDFLLVEEMLLGNVLEMVKVAWLEK